VLGATFTRTRSTAGNGESSQCRSERIRRNVLECFLSQQKHFFFGKMNATRPIAMASSYFRSALKVNSIRDGKQCVNVALSRSQGGKQPHSNSRHINTFQNAPKAYSDTSDVRSTHTTKIANISSFTKSSERVSTGWFSPIAGNCELTGF